MSEKNQHSAEGSSPEHLGERYLGLIGLGHLAHTPMVIDGTQRKGRDFLEHKKCAAMAGPALEGFAAMSPDHPDYSGTLAALQAAVSHFMNASPEN